jgi:uncharacterized protein YndB with AHSA1/START domain
MTAPGQLTIKPQGDRELVMTRAFAAPREAVFDAYTRPELLRRWLGQMPGWNWVTCEVDLRVGGSYRWEWKQEATEYVMGMGGEYRDIEAPKRIVCTEKFDDAWYPGGAISTLELREQPGGTLMVNTLRYESAEALQAVLASPMEEGVTSSYDHLEKLLLERVADGAA